MEGIATAQARRRREEFIAGLGNGGYEISSGVHRRAEPSPDKAFDREWALALLAQVIERLQAECVADGKGKLFEQLKIFLATGKGEAAHGEVANALGMEEGAVRVAVHRLRKRYRQLLRDEIANTLSDAAMVDEEMRTLFGAFGG